MIDYQTYIENVKIIRNLSKVMIDEKDDKETIINKIKDNALKSFNYKTWNDNFLNENVFSKRVEDITKEEADDLFEFVEEVFNYADSLDSGIAYKLYEKLLEYAKYNNDVSLYIKELYNCGMALFYLNTRNTETGDSLFKDRITSFFSEGASYIDRFEEFDSDTRQYIIRCLGNTKVCINRFNKEGVSEYYKVYDEVMSIISSEKLHEIDPTLTWDKFIYGMNMDQLSIIAYLRTEKDPIVANKVLEAAKYVYDKNIYDKNDTRLQNWRIDYYYKAALYHAGKITIKELVNELIKIADSADRKDFSMSGINRNLTAKAYLLCYAKRLDKEDKEKIAPYISNSIKDAYRYIDSLPGEYYRHTVTNAVKELVDMQSEVSENDKTDMMNYLVAIHKPTYIHSLMVASLTKALTACMMMRKPEELIGVLGTKSKEDVLAKSEDILNLAYNCGIYHDVGKNMCMSYININERKLIDEEFECIKTHTSQGYELLNKNKDNNAYALAALYHHVYYDGSNGYPKKLEPCPSFIKPIIDILSVADSIDAATDSIGRHYNRPKTLDTLIDEFRQGKGIRYSPAVVDLFNEQTVKDYINNIITNERLIIYLNVYHKGRSYTISSYLKDN